MYIDKLKHIITKILEPSKPTMLGRWQVKNCNEIKTILNNIYQNRDHCGDVICKTPLKPEKYINKQYK